MTRAQYSPPLKVIQIRPASSGLTLDEALARRHVVTDRVTLLEYLQKHFAFWNPTDENVTIKRHGYDHRCGWDLHLICVDGKAALFSDGPLPVADPA